MKKEFEKPELLVILFNNNDIILTSAGDVGDPLGEDEGND